MKKSLISTKFRNTPRSQKGSGDFYGSGVKNPVGKMIEGSGEYKLSKKKLSKPPKSLA